MDHLPLSLLNDYLYCERRAALKTVEGVRSANAHTAKGDIVHEHADLPGYEVAKGVTLLRALPVDAFLSALPPGHPAHAFVLHPLLCHDGQGWTWDGVHFRMIHPP